MNINESGLVRYQKKDGLFYKINQSSQAKFNLDVLLEPKLIDLFEKEINTFEVKSDFTADNRIIKQKIIMDLLWREAIVYTAQRINTQLVNLKVDFGKKVRKLVYIEFPAVGSDFCESVESVTLQKIH